MLMSSIPQYDEEKEKTNESGDTYREVEDISEVLPLI